jgi:hypothetical protein
MAVRSRSFGVAVAVTSPRLPDAAGRFKAAPDAAALRALLARDEALSAEVAA